MRLSELGFEGLDEFSDEVWRTVARHPYSGVDLLAEWLHRPEPIVQAEMDRLVEAGLVRQVGHQWEPQDPVRVLQARHALREAALVAERARMADERAQLYRSGLFGDYVAGRRRAGTNAGVQVLARDEIFPRMAELTGKSARSIRFLLTGPPPPGLGGDIPDLLIPAAGRGVHIASVWTATAIGAVRRRTQGRRLPPIGQIHVAPALPMRVIVWDSTAAIVPVRDDDLDDGAFVVVAPTLVRAVSDLVSRTQRAAAQRSTPEVVVDEPATMRRQRALLRLLDVGLDDSRAARELGVSDRTVKRDVADLCQRFGVLTRFQLGAAAARAGYLARAGRAAGFGGGAEAIDPAEARGLAAAGGAPGGQRGDAASFDGVADVTDVAEVTQMAGLAGMSGTSGLSGVVGAAAIGGRAPAAAIAGGRPPSAALSGGRPSAQGGSRGPGRRPGAPAEPAEPAELGSEDQVRAGVGDLGRPVPGATGQAGRRGQEDGAGWTGRASRGAQGSSGGSGSRGSQRGGNAPARRPRA